MVICAVALLATGCASAGEREVDASALAILLSERYPDRGVNDSGMVEVDALDHYALVLRQICGLNDEQFNGVLDGSVSGSTPVSDLELACPARFR